METESHEFHKKIQKDLHDFNIFAGLAASIKDQCVLMVVSFSFAQDSPWNQRGALPHGIVKYSQWSSNKNHSQTTCFKSISHLHSGNLDSVAWHSFV